MHVISRPRLNAFGAEHPDAMDQLQIWFHVMKRARFQSPHMLKQSFPTADQIGDGFVVFNLGGNRYRIVAHVKYATATNLGRVYVRHVFTHKDYDFWNAQRRGNKSER
jgi:mRNA interferase HigB